MGMFNKKTVDTCQTLKKAGIHLREYTVHYILLDYLHKNDTTIKRIKHFLLHDVDGETCNPVLKEVIKHEMKFIRDTNYNKFLKYPFELLMFDHVRTVNALHRQNRCDTINDVIKLINSKEKVKGFGEFCQKDLEKQFEYFDIEIIK